MLVETPKMQQVSWERSPSQVVGRTVNMNGDAFFCAPDAHVEQFELIFMTTLRQLADGIPSGDPQDWRG